MFVIEKAFQVTYGHRIATQTLSDNRECQCRRLHGHGGSLVIELSSKNLVRGMVLDYNELDIIKAFIDKFLDHRMILDKDDPMLNYLIKEYEIVDSQWRFSKIRKSNDYEDLVEQELYESLILIDCEPTSENFCKILYNELKQIIPWVSKVSWSETGKTNATYME
jgi:6-pyruvoyl-tetrahydropterin synthase